MGMVRLILYPVFISERDRILIGRTPQRRAKVVQ